MVEFEVIKEKVIPFGKRNFIEVAYKRAVSSRGETEFISIARGYFTQEDEKRYRKSVTIPVDNEVLLELAEEIQEMMEAIGGSEEG